MPLDNSIAELRLLGVRSDGSRVSITVAVGQPYRGAHHWGCPVALTGLHDRLSDIAGDDALQALCLAVRFAGLRLADFVAKGGRLYSENGGPEADGTELPLDAYFGPLIEPPGGRAA
jgi:hypothetical protein